MEAVIFIGVQASGKTTFYQQRFLATHVRISMDLLKTRNREQVFLQTCLRTGQRFVIDNTNPRRADRAGYIAAAKSAGFKVAGYLFETELRDAIARNAHRAGKAAIPVPGLIRAYKLIERPNAAEGFDQLSVVSIRDGKFQVQPFNDPGLGAQENNRSTEVPSRNRAGWNDRDMDAGLTPGLYANRTGRYEVLPDGTAWLIGGADLPGGALRQQVSELPSDAAMINSAMDVASSRGTTPPGKGPDPAKAHKNWEK